MAYIPRTEFAQALNQLASERGIDAGQVLETIKLAYIAAYRRDARERGEEIEGFEFDAEIDPVSGEARILSWPEGKNSQKKDVTPAGFGRIAAQTAKQVILQKVREAEKESVISAFEGRIGSLVSGVVLRFDGPNVRVDIGKSEAILPASERIPNERLKISQRLSFLLKEIREGLRGKEIILSRSDTQFVEKLFAREVPEMASGSVAIKEIAREAGVRTKIAVVSAQSGVDPVGSCVGQKGVRVQAVIQELLGEKIDVLPWSEDPSEMIALALSPAKDAKVKLNKKGKKATVKIPADQLSLAIGKDGQNVRIASKLTGWDIKIEEAKPPKKQPETKEIKKSKKEKAEAKLKS